MISFADAPFHFDVTVTVVSTPVFEPATTGNFNVASIAFLKSVIAADAVNPDATTTLSASMLFTLSFVFFCCCLRS